MKTEQQQQQQQQQPNEQSFVGVTCFEKDESLVIELFFVIIAPKSCGEWRKWQGWWQHGCWRGWCSRVVCEHQ